MCGRYSLITGAQILTEQFGLPDRAIPNPLRQIERYNIAPAQPIPIIRTNLDNHLREFVLVNWGFIPQWAKNTAIGYRLIRIDAEKIREKSTYSTAFKRRRCLIPVTAFYEWQLSRKAVVGPRGGKRSGPKQPFVIKMADENLFAFAGLWEHWQSPDGSEIESCTILMTDANELMAAIHHRMPVIIDPADYKRWLSAAPNDVFPLLKPYPADAMLAQPVSTYVNNAKHDDAKCLEIIGEQQQLFDD